MQEKNIVGLLDEDAYTVKVSFHRDPVRDTFPAKTYSYLTNLPGIKVGDYVVVSANNSFNVVFVMEVTPGVDCPDGVGELAWVVSKVDLTYHSNLVDRNKRIKHVAQEAYKKAMQQSFAQRVLAELDSDSSQQIKKLLKPTN